MTKIYCHTCLPTSKKYVGKTIKSIEERFQEHVKNSNKEHRIHSHFENALKKYGKENFTSELLEEVENTIWVEREIYWISEMDSFTNGYNMTIGGEGTSGFFHSEETKLKMSESAMGKVFTDKHKENLSKSKIGVPQSEEHTQAITEGCHRGEDHHYYGKDRDELTKEKISDGLKEYYSNNPSPRIGTKHSSKTKELMSKNHADISGDKNPNYNKKGSDNHNFGRKWMTKNNKSKIIRMADIEKLLEDGWKMGRN